MWAHPSKSLPTTALAAASRRYYLLQLAAFAGFVNFIFGHLLVPKTVLNGTMVNKSQFVLPLMIGQTLQLLRFLAGILATSATVNRKNSRWGAFSAVLCPSLGVKMSSSRDDKKKKENWTHCTSWCGAIPLVRSGVARRAAPSVIVLPVQPAATRRPS